MEKDWEARFANRAPSRKLNGTAALAAGGYWMVVAALFLVLISGGGDVTGEGVGLVIMPTLPSSLLMLPLISVVGPLFLTASNPPYRDPLDSSLGMFVLFPLISGGINSFIIYWFVSAIQRRRGRKSERL